MINHWTPSTRKDLITWIKRQYWTTGQTCSGLEKKSTKQLYAIFYSLVEKKQTAKLNGEFKHTGVL